MRRNVSGPEDWIPHSGSDSTDWKDATSASSPSTTARGAASGARCRGRPRNCGALEASVHELAALRNAALRIFVASRHAATVIAQREFWLEFSWADQEYRVAVRRLALFCLERRDGSPARARSL